MRAIYLQVKCTRNLFLYRYLFFFCIIYNINDFAYVNLLLVFEWPRDSPSVLELAVGFRFVFCRRVNIICIVCTKLSQI